MKMILPGLYVNSAFLHFRLISTVTPEMPISTMRIALFVCITLSTKSSKMSFNTALTDAVLKQTKTSPPKHRSF